VDTLAVWGHGKANTITLSPDGQRLAVGTGIGVFLYESLDFRLISVLPTPFSVQSIAFSPDSQLMALGQSQGIIDVYELMGPTQVIRINVTGTPISDPHQVEVLFSQNGAYLITVISGTDTLTIHRWQTSTWQSVNAFALESGILSYLNPGVELIGILSEDALSLQSLSVPEESRTIPLPPAEPRSYWEGIPVSKGEIVPSTAGDFILINNGSTILHWTLVEEVITYRVDDYPTELPDPCYIAPDTCRNTQGGFSWTCTETIRIPPIEKIVLTPDNAHFLVSLNPNRAEFRQTRDGAILWQIETAFTQVAFAPDSEFFYGLRHDGGIEKRSVFDGGLVFSLYQHPSQLNTLGFSPDGSVLAAGYNDGWIRVFSTLDGEMLGVLDGSATAVQFSPDGLQLAAGLQDGTVRIFDLGAGRYDDLQSEHLAAVRSVAFAAGSTTLTTASLDCTLSSWDLGGNFRRWNLTPGGTDPFQIITLEAAMQDGYQYLLGKENGVFRVKDRESNALYTPPNTAFQDLALSPDGQQLALTGPGGTWLFNPLAADAIQTLRDLPSQTDGSGSALAYTPDGKLLIVATNLSLEFWQVPEGVNLGFRPFTASTQPDNQPVDLVISPDGSLIALASEDGLIYLFAVREDAIP
jgi:WD40 repeat protein